MPRVVMTPAERFQRWRDMARLSVRQNSLLRRAYEFHKNHGAEVFLVLYHHHKFHVYTSSTHPAWPPSLSDIVCTLPAVYTHIQANQILRRTSPPRPLTFTPRTPSRARSGYRSILATLGKRLL